MRKWNRVVRSYLKKVKSANCELKIKMIGVIHTKPPNQCKHRKMYIKKNMNVAKLRRLKTKIDVFIFQLNINAYTINDEYSNHKETSQSTFIC